MNTERISASAFCYVNTNLGITILTGNNVLLTRLCGDGKIAVPSRIPSPSIFSLSMSDINDTNAILGSRGYPKCPFPHGKLKPQSSLVRNGVQKILHHQDPLVTEVVAKAIGGNTRMSNGRSRHSETATM